MGHSYHAPASTVVIDTAMRLGTEVFGATRGDGQEASGASSMVVLCRAMAAFSPYTVTLESPETFRIPSNHGDELVY